MNDDPVIQVQGLVNRFGNQAVHVNLDLNIRRGEILGVVGGSGTGKSVLLRSIVGLRQPNAGAQFSCGGSDCHERGSSEAGRPPLMR